VTTLGILIPLVASGRTVWAQIQKGVLDQPATTPQQDSRTSSPASTP
jgi:hypothetical protein